MAHQFMTSYVRDSVALFAYYRKLAEKAMEQISDEEFFRALDPEANSVAVLVKHMAGNMRSRWTDFLTTDGEKPDRNRDSEFIAESTSRAEYMKSWNDGWRRVFSALEPLNDSDLPRKIIIRGEPHSVTQAINPQIAHYGYHVGQIVFLCKHFRSAEWKTLSVPRGKSQTFTADVAAGKRSQR
jgi:uncharacterized protein DUF1572